MTSKAGWASAMLVAALSAGSGVAAADTTCPPAKALPERKCLDPKAPARLPAGTDPSGIAWVRLPAGAFEMGSTTGNDDEKPVHRVSVAAFELMKTEVTVAAYERCVAEGPCSAPHWDDGTCWRVDLSKETLDGGLGAGVVPASFRGAEQPVVCVDAAQAEAFCAYAGGRLPSEAEWEYAARSGGRAVTYPWGDAPPTCERAVFQESSEWKAMGCGRPGTWPVCSKAAGSSAQGICDLAGNVWEWTADCYHGTYAGAPSDGTALTTECGSELGRVYRGGSWISGPGFLRASFRFGDGPGERLAHVGVRCAR